MAETFNDRLGILPRLLTFNASSGYLCAQKRMEPTLSGGSLGSWVDEERSKLRVVV